MGDYYDFEIRDIDGKEVAGFVYPCNGEEIFAELSFNQMELAVAWHNKETMLMQEKQRLIKAFLGL